MARSGISFEQVAAVADALVANGEEPTTRAVRVALRTGSPNTIHRHLRQWFEQRAQPTAAQNELPSDVIRSVQAALLSAAAAAKAEVTSQLAHARREAADLADAGEALEAELETLREHVRLITSELDSQRGRSAEQATELARAEADLGRERAAAESARLEAAQLRHVVDEHRTLLVDRATELEQLRQRNREEQETRIATERDLAVAKAARAHLEERLHEHTQRAQASERDLSTLRTRVEHVLEREREQITAAAQRDESLRAELARCQAECSKLQLQLDARETGRGKPKP